VRHPSFDVPMTMLLRDHALGPEGHVRFCVQTLDLWTSVLRRRAGNLALRCLLAAAFGRRGIAVKIRKKLEDGTFSGHSVKKKNLARCWPKSPFKCAQ